MRSLIALAAAGLGLLIPGPLSGHCDGLDGPVVNAARQALDTGDVQRVLIWVHDAAEPGIRQAFARTLAVRKLNPEARELADLYFFEIVVRLHRAGEGAPYTGLKPAGRDPGPAITAADKAVESGSVDTLAGMLSHASADGIKERFERVAAAKSYRTADVAAGRGYVKAYVEFVHYVERLHDAAHAGAHAH